MGNYEQLDQMTKMLKVMHRKRKHYFCKSRIFPILFNFFFSVCFFTVEVQVTVCTLWIRSIVLGSVTALRVTFLFQVEAAGVTCLALRLEQAQVLIFKSNTARSPMLP